MIDKVLCDKCGTEMIPVDSERSVGMKCPNCGWGWVTSYIDPIKEDETIYEISLEEGNQVTKDNIRFVSEISDVNFLEAKRLLENAPKSFISGNAVDINDAVIRLKVTGINFTVTPEYPYLKND